ncbi:hypothetical protein VroAM7_50370 (plasmid) [Vibrio rotiferianus]|uniref:FCP1 homology domain-containing protein n=1 Tax=Vibrio rotiferianus TaxID=190895 RepID=A0A510IF24_9VIBR|nr:HAD domain-containing protein [Vibrio rotiferianus]BBL92384.1 hypothetical protein VroAM7_50370 [Vibrio rotiferianus]
MFIVLFCIVAITLWLLNKFVLPFNNQPLSDNPAVMNPVLPVKKETPAYKLALPTLTKSSPTLFLDIDGVCHKNFDESLSHLPILEAFLEEHKGVQIVISSTWRTTCEKEFLARCLGKKVWASVVGFTPILGTREQEVLSFVESHSIEHFVCLDDDRTEFFGGVPVIFTDRSSALTSREVSQLSRWYHRAR